MTEFQGSQQSPYFTVVFNLILYLSSPKSQLASMYCSKFKHTPLVLSFLSIASIVSAVSNFEARQIPANATDVTTIQSPAGVTIRYKEPGKYGVCETTPGVGSYAGYVDLAPDSHTFFWFFEARNNPATAPLTLWLNGGPGSDSLIGLFQGMHRSVGSLHRR